MKKLFVIGDSISCYYGRHLEKMLSGIMEYDRKGGTNILKDLEDCTDGVNGGDSSMVLTYLTEVVNREWFKPDILLLNCGLHDIKESGENGELQVSPENYKKNLNKILSLAKEKNIAVVWARITPFNKKHAEANVFRKEENIDKYNSIADKVMKENSVPEIDLFSFTKSLGDDIYLNGTDSVHFNDKAATEQATFIAGWLSCIQSQTKNREEK